MKPELPPDPPEPLVVRLKIVGPEHGHRIGRGEPLQADVVVGRFSDRNDAHVHVLERLGHGARRDDQVAAVAQGGRLREETVEPIEGRGAVFLRDGAAIRAGGLPAAQPALGRVDDDQHGSLLHLAEQALHALPRSGGPGLVELAFGQAVHRLVQEQVEGQPLVRRPPEARLKRKGDVLLARIQHVVHEGGLALARHADDRHDGRRSSGHRLEQLRLLIGAAHEKRRRRRQVVVSQGDAARRPADRPEGYAHLLLQLARRAEGAAVLLAHQRLAMLALPLRLLGRLLRRPARVEGLGGQEYEDGFAEPRGAVVLALGVGAVRLVLRRRAECLADQANHRIARLHERVEELRQVAMVRAQDLLCHGLNVSLKEDILHRLAALAQIGRCGADKDLHEDTRPRPAHAQCPFCNGRGFGSSGPCPNGPTARTAD